MMRESNNNKVILIAFDKKLQMCLNIPIQEPCLVTDGSLQRATDEKRDPLVSFADFALLGKKR